MSRSVPGFMSIFSCPPTNLASHCATRSAVARPSGPFTRPTGAQPPSMEMPSAAACSISCLLACILSTANTEVSVTSAPCVAETWATSCAMWPAIAPSKSVGFACSMWPRRRATVATSMDVSPPPTTTTRLPTWRRRPSLNAFRNDVAVTTLGACESASGSGRPPWAPMPRKTASNVLRISSIEMSVPTRHFMRVSIAEVEDALDLGVEDVARRAEARDAVAHHAAQVLVVVEDGDRVPLERQLVGAGEPGGTAAQHGDLLAGGRRGLRVGELVGVGVVAEEVLDGVDADVVLDLVAVAARSRTAPGRRGP